jgi:hypothetical protein
VGAIRYDHAKSLLPSRNGGREPCRTTTNHKHFCRIQQLQTSPLQEYKFGTKTRAHRRKNAERAWLRATVLHNIFEYDQDRCGREIPDLFQAIPGCVELTVV